MRPRPTRREAAAARHASLAAEVAAILATARAALSLHAVADRATCAPPPEEEADEEDADEAL